MGFSKKILYRIYDVTRHNPRGMKKIIIFTGAAILCSVVFAGFLIFSAISGLKGLAASSPDIDLLALQELMANKALLLTETQRAQMTPLVQKILRETIIPSDRADLKRQLYGLLDPIQIKQVEDWKAANIRKAGKFTSTPQNIISALERYTGISMKPLREWIDNVLLSWWKITKPEDSAKGLIEVLNEKKLHVAGENAL
jgi:hypothetical protein